MIRLSSATWLFGVALACAVLLAAGPALAHQGEGVAGGFVSGVLHPLFGADHVAAMLAVGLWGAFLGAPAIWLLPIVFPLVMALGGALGLLGAPIPEVETGIAYDDGTPETVDNYARDVAAFLMWAAEPKLEERHRLGFRVMLYLALLAAFLYLAKRRIWARLEAH